MAIKSLDGVPGILSSFLAAMVTTYSVFEVKPNINVVVFVTEHV